MLRRFTRRLFVDVGAPDATTFIAGMGRSGTTWIGALVNHDHSYRVLFEPFRPHVVPAARAFGPFAYLAPSHREPSAREAAEQILSGHTPRGTVDRENRGVIFRRRLVKEIRCNLMLAWLRTIRPAMPIILVVRNPLAVAASWLRLGWGRIAGGEKYELDVILEHEALLRDFPVIRQALDEADRNDMFERHIMQWCVLHLVPFRHLHQADAHVIFYENAVRNPHGAIQSLSAYLEQPITGPGVERALKDSKVDFLERGTVADRGSLLEEWRSVLSPEQEKRARELLEIFGLDHLYDERWLPRAKAGADVRGAARSGS